MPKIKLNMQSMTPAAIDETLVRIVAAGRIVLLSNLDEGKLLDIIAVFNKQVRAVACNMLVELQRPQRQHCGSKR